MRQPRKAVTLTRWPSGNNQINPNQHFFELSTRTYFTYVKNKFLLNFFKKISFYFSCHCINLGNHKMTFLGDYNCRLWQLNSSFQWDDLLWWIYVDLFSVLELQERRNGPFMILYDCFRYLFSSWFQFKEPSYKELTFQCKLICYFCQNINLMNMYFIHYFNEMFQTNFVKVSVVFV